MENEQLLAIVIMILVVAGTGLVISTFPESEVVVEYSYELAITADGDSRDISYGFPEEGFWGEENGAIDWREMPFNQLHESRYTYKNYTYEFWFRERLYNGTQYQYDNHGPFFVHFPPHVEYQEVIPLNEHNITINIHKIVEG
jgi:hypothetical protein